MNYPVDSFKQNTGETRQDRKKSKSGGAGVLIAVLLWGGLVFGGFYTTKHYIDKAIQKVQQTNAMNVQAINERLDTLTSDMKGLKSVLRDADQTLSTSGSLQEELNEKIVMLEQQLKDLETSLKILKEAPNGAR